MSQIPGDAALVRPRGRDLCGRRDRARSWSPPQSRSVPRSAIRCGPGISRANVQVSRHPMTSRASVFTAPQASSFPTFISWAVAAQRQVVHSHYGAPPLTLLSIVQGVYRGGSPNMMRPSCGVSDWGSALGGSIEQVATGGHGQDARLRRQAGLF